MGGRGIPVAYREETKTHDEVKALGRVELEALLANESWHKAVFYRGDGILPRPIL